LLAQGAKVIVVACNTASAAALHHLRRVFPNAPFVGMEPAVKPAVEQTRNGVVGVIATHATFQGELFASLVERFASDTRVLTQVCPALVDAVEAGALDTPETEAAVRQCIAPLLAANIDQLVLGCTHYPFLRSVIERVTGAQVAVIDPAPAVARQTARVLSQRRLTAPPHCHGTDVCRHTFYTTGDRPAFDALVNRLIPDLNRDTITVRQARWRAGRLEVEPTA
jgi:glutamate racemase